MRPMRNVVMITERDLRRVPMDDRLEERLFDTFKQSLPTIMIKAVAFVRLLPPQWRPAR